MTLQRLPEFASAEIEHHPRHYLIDGEKYQRVTTALGVINKPALGPWMVKTAIARMQEILLDPKVSSELGEVIENLPEEGAPAGEAYAGWVERVAKAVKAAPTQERDERADFGTEVHQAINRYLTSDMVIELEPRASQAIRFLEDWRVNVLATEFVVWDQENKVAGTIDGVGRLPNGDLIIWDWKTGSGPWWEMALQLGAYDALLHTTTGLVASRGFIVKLTDDSYTVHQVLDLGLASLAYWSSRLLHQHSKAKWFEEVSLSTQ